MFAADAADAAAEPAAPPKKKVKAPPKPIAEEMAEDIIPMLEKVRRRPSLLPLAVFAAGGWSWSGDADGRNGCGRAAEPG